MNKPSGFKLDALEFTLEDTYDLLKETKKERQFKIKTLIDKVKECSVLSEDLSCDELREKQHIYVNNLQQCVKEDIPKDYSLPNTRDMDESVLQHLAKDLKCDKILEMQIKKEIEKYEDDINELIKKKNGLRDMKEAYLNAKHNKQFQDYREQRKRIADTFQSTKQDLVRPKADIVNMIFPENYNFEELLANLTSAYTRGGDDVYIEVIDEQRACIKFLDEIDLITYHPHNKQWIKLQHLL